MVLMMQMLYSPPKQRTWRVVMEFMCRELYFSSCLVMLGSSITLNC